MHNFSPSAKTWNEDRCCIKIEIAANFAPTEKQILDLRVYVIDMSNSGSAKGHSELEKLYEHFWHPAEGGPHMGVRGLQRVPVLHII